MTSRNRVAVVTGGAQGIGFSISKRLAEEGCKVVIADLNEETGMSAAETIIADGGSSLFLRADVSEVDSIQNLVNAVMKNFGAIHILINNAGLLQTTALEDVTVSEWDKIMNVNLRGVFFACQKVIPHMMSDKYGRIINVSSLAGRMGGVSTGLAYTASKAGIIGLTRGLALRTAEYNITVNAVAPATTESPMTRQFSQDELSRLQNMIPLKRFGKPEEIAAAVAFLASDEAGFITGAVLDINGGLYMG